MMKKLLMTLPVVALLGCSTIPDGVSTDQNKCLVFNNKENSPTPDMPISIAPTYLSQDISSNIVNTINKKPNGIICITGDKVGLMTDSSNPVAIYVNRYYLASLIFGSPFTCFRGEHGTEYKIQMRFRQARTFLDLNVVAQDNVPKIIQFKLSPGIFLPTDTLLKAKEIPFSIDLFDNAIYSVKNKCMIDGGTSIGAGLGVVSLGGAAMLAGPVAGAAVILAGNSALGTSGEVINSNNVDFDKLIPIIK